jgi:molybdopterin/thiamine biosynthesis adenylyltransferase
MIKYSQWQPQFITADAIDVLKQKQPELLIVDKTRDNLKEIFLLRNPNYRFNKNYEKQFDNFWQKYNNGSNDFVQWIYFSWINTLVRYLSEELYYELRTGRNKNLISEQEQNRFYYSTVVFLGLSVGSHIALTTAMTGGARRMKLVDPTIFSGSNFNRIRVGFQNVGLNKTIVIARQIYEINPYAQIEIYPEGLNKDNAAQILQDADIVIEEMDNPYWKLRIRELAREKGIPVLMATDNGDGVIVDIERYDTNKNLLILNGLIGNLSAEQLKNISNQELPRIVGKIAGANLVVPRMLESVTEIGKTLYSWPQLGTAATMAGSVIAYLARRIILRDKKIKSGRYTINLDKIFESDYQKKWLSRKLVFLKFIHKVSK